MSIGLAKLDVFIYNKLLFHLSWGKAIPNIPEEVSYFPCLIFSYLGSVC